MIYYVKPDRSEVYFVTSQPEPDFRIELWSAKGDVKELRCGVRGLRPARSRMYWPPARTCTNGRWSTAIRLIAGPQGNVTLLGDACHPMTPYMAQGAAMAIEDAAVLSRCLDGVERDGVARAFHRFEATRKQRTTRVQQTSRTNTWLKDKDRHRLGLRLRRLDRSAGGVAAQSAAAKFRVPLTASTLMPRDRAS